MHIIGITGKKKSGKTTAALFIKDIIDSLYPREVCHILSFADPLKDEVCEAVGCCREYLEQHKDSFRRILQGWGTDYRRNLCGTDYWTHKMLLRIRDVGRDPNVHTIVIPDVRFLNEAAMIKGVGGLVLRVTRHHLNEEGVEEYDVNTHQSEVELNDIIPNHYINNTSSKEELKNMVRDFLVVNRLMQIQHT